MKRLYLETNALNALSYNELHDDLRSHSYTSMLSILEILSGLEQKNYQRYRSTLVKTIKSGVYIDWRHPTQIIAESFQLEGYKNKKLKQFMNTVNLVLDMQDYSDTIRLSANNDRYLSLDSIKKMDEEICKPDIDFFHKTKGIVNQNLATIEYRDRFKTILSKNREQISTKEFIEINDIITIVKNMKVLNYAISFMEGKSDQEINDCARKYNNSIDFYLFLDSYRNIKNMFNGTEPSNNDSWDTSHLLYINNWDSILLTGDKKLFDDVYFLYPESVESTTKYKLQN